MVSRTSVIRSLVLAVLTMTLLSFTENPGGDSFSIWLNDNLLHQQHLTSKAEVKTISLSVAKPENKIRIYFSECGKIGTGRTIHIHDESGKTVKRWTFKNSDGKDHEPMFFTANSLPAESAAIAYSSDLMSKPILLVKLTMTDGQLTSRKWIHNWQHRRDPFSRLCCCLNIRPWW